MYNTIIRQSFRHTGGGIIKIPTIWDIKLPTLPNFYFLILLLINFLLILYIWQNLAGEYEFVAI